MTAKDKEALVDETGRHSTDPKHAPVALPPGSFDLDKLGKGLDKVVSAKPDKRDETIRTALESAAGEATVLDQRDRRAQPGFVEVEVKNEDLGIVEKALVFSEKEQARADAVTEAQAEQTGGEATTNAAVENSQKKEG